MMTGLGSRQRTSQNVTAERYHKFTDSYVLEGTSGDDLFQPYSKAVSYHRFYRKTFRWVLSLKGKNSCLGLYRLAREFTYGCVAEDARFWICFYLFLPFF